MIEFLHVTNPGLSEVRTPIALNVDSIEHFEPLAGDARRALVVLKSGRQLTSDVSYAELRRLVVEAAGRGHDLRLVTLKIRPRLGRSCLASNRSSSSRLLRSRWSSRLSTKRTNP
jgi:hypothetical protein